MQSTLKKLLGHALGMMALSWMAPGTYGDVTINTLISFNPATGAKPVAGLVQAPDGAFYGTTQTGGIYKQGTIFRITSDGTFTNLFSFAGTNGANPVAGLIWGGDGNLYGTTESGGTANHGTVFQVTTNGVLTSLVSFTGTNGAYPGDFPTAGLIWDTNGSLYGTTQYGGTNDPADGGDGTIFELASNGVFTSLVSFSGTNGEQLGANPAASLILGADGNFYGTTQYGGTNDLTNGGDGTVFRLNPAGAFATLVSFDDTHGANPQAGLAQGADGNFYGTTYNGGSNALGTVFKMTPPGEVTTLFPFDNTNGANPYAGLVQGLDGDFYGTAKVGGASTYGTVFQITPSGRFTSLASFGNTNGAYPVAGLIQGSDGNFYGTTASGGTNYAYGTVFRFTPPPLFLKQWQTNGAFAFTWSAATGRTYQVQFITNLAQTNWSNLEMGIAATNSTGTAVDPIGTNEQRFYRVELGQ